LIAKEIIEKSITDEKHKEQLEALLNNYEESKNNMKHLLANYEKILKENDELQAQINEIIENKESLKICIKCKENFIPGDNNEVKEEFFLLFIFKRVLARIIQEA